MLKYCNCAHMLKLRRSTHRRQTVIKKTGRFLTRVLIRPSVSTVSSKIRSVCMSSHMFFLCCFPLLFTKSSSRVWRFSFFANFSFFLISFHFIMCNLELICTTGYLTQATDRESVCLTETQHGINIKQSKLNIKL